jgi:(p)ppGpp synthase/HD superfamily hydrolase
MRLKSYISILEDAATIEDFAEKFGSIKHKGQRRKFSNEPYFEHPKRVAAIVKKFKQSHKLDQLISASLLHDTIEDTNTTFKDLNKLFGGLVASIVKELTSDPEEIKKVGKSKYLSDKMINMSDWALVIKLADRLDNVSDLKQASSSFRDKTVRSTKEILSNLESKRNLTTTQKNIISVIKQKLRELE